MKNIRTYSFLFLHLFSFIFINSTRAAEQNLDLSLSAGNYSHTLSFFVSKSFYLFNQNTIALDTGIRSSHFIGRNNIAYKTANANLIKNNEIDQLIVKNAQTNSLNLFFGINAKVFQNFFIGFNLDLFGLGYGSNKDGEYRGRSNNYNTAQSAKPSLMNLFLGGNSDLGQLNSEFFIAYKLNQRWSVRTGLSHFFSEYETNNSLDSSNNRFRFIANSLFISAAVEI